MNKEIILKNKSINTKIIIKNNFISTYLKTLQKKDQKIFCVVDTKVRYIFKNLKRKKNFYIIYINGGEKIKSIDTYNKVCEKLLFNKIDRSSIIVGIGGGTIGDLSGFIASTLLRGINFNLIPTTLLSQVDSSIGGKNGVNSIYGKNLIGSFYQPYEVLIDTQILQSLPKREILAGYSEIVKHSLIKDAKFFNWLERNYINLLSLENKILETAILKSLKIKWGYVKKDPNENLTNHNSRSMLNFGHTIGHALERIYNYKTINHGEAISIGMIAEAKISNKLGYLSKKNLIKIIDHFKKINLKISDENLKKEKILTVIYKDKKNSNHKINLALLNKIGSSFFKRNIKIVDIKKLLKKI